MPFNIRKVRNKDCYRVKNIKNNKIHAICSTKENALKQIRLLHAIDNNPKFKLNRK